MKAKTSALFDDLSGKAGNIVASRNSGGLYVKPRRIPRNPRSSSQMSTRGILSANSKSWESLTQEQREAWNAAALTYQSSSKNFGESAKLSGINAYVKFNNNLGMIGEALITEPPKLPEFPAFAIQSVEFIKEPEQGDKLQLTLSGTKIGVNFIIVCRATAPFSQGRESMASGLRIISMEKSTGNNSINVNDAYIAKFSSIPEAGKKVQFEVFLIDKDSGAASLKQTYVWLRKD